MFTVNGSGHGSVDIGPTPLVNGQATLDAALGANPDIIVDLAGTWTVTARYIPGTDPRYTVEIPDNVASYHDRRAARRRARHRDRAGDGRIR